MTNNPTQNLDEPIKTLQCINEISELCRNETDAGTLLKKSAERIPHAFQIPDISHCQIHYRGKAYTNSNFNESSNQFCTETSTATESLRICTYIEGNENKILNAERLFIESIASILSIALEKIEETTQQGANEKLFRGFYEAGLVGLAVTSIEKGWLMVNDRLCQILGYTKDELIQMTWTELTHPDDLEPDLKLFQQLLDGTHEYYELEKRFFHKDESIVYAKMAVKVVRKADGIPDYFLAMVEDTTERSVAELQLKRKHEEMLTIFNSSETLIYVVDSKTDKLVYSNRKDLQNPNDESRQKKCYEVIHHQKERCSFCTNDQLHKDGIPIRWEKNEEDSDRCYQYLDQLVNWPDGRELRLTLATEITELAQARRAIAQERERYRRIFDTATVSIWDEDWSEVYRLLRPLIKNPSITDYQIHFEDHPDLVREALRAVKITDINDETLRMFEAQDKSELLISLETIFASENSSIGFIGELVAICEGKKIHQAQMQLSTVQGNLREVLRTMTFPPINERGDCVIISSMDITERVKNERTLKALTDKVSHYSDRMSAVMNSIDALIYVADMHTHEILFINAYGRKVFGDAEGKTCWKTLQSGLDQPCEFCTNHLLVKNGHSAGVHHWEFQNTVNGRWYDCRDEAIPWTDGRLVRMEIATDITDRKQSELQLSNTLLKLEQSNEELEQFAYVASHDLQEPLRMVTSFTQLFAKKYEGLLDEKARSYVEFVVDGCSRMQRLLNDLLAFSRVDRKGDAFSKCSLQEVLEKVLKNLTLQINEHKVHLTHDSLPTVLADETQMMQLYQNLISNALKFRSTQPLSIHLGAKEEEGFWKLWVSDNGIGIDPKYQSRVFEVFQRLHTRETYSGTGIGLSVCKKIVERHQGKIWIESTPGNGSTFYFTLNKQI